MKSYQYRKTTASKSPKMACYFNWAADHILFQSFKYEKELMKHKWEPYSGRFEWRDIHETLSFIRPAICCIVYRRIQVFLSTLGSNCAQKTWQYLYLIKWFEPKRNIPWLKKIIWVIGVLRRTVVWDWLFRDNLCGSNRWTDGFRTGCRNVSHKE